MTNIRIEETVIQSIRKLGLDAEQILPVHDLQCDLGVDSTEMVELAALIRTECGLSTRRIDLGRVRTVQDLVGAVEALLKEQSV